MRFGGRRLFGAMALYALVLFGSPGCSGDQGQEEPVVEDNAGSGENQAAGDNNEGGDNQAAADDEGSDQAAGSGNSTENDLQDIIQEMNGQTTADGTGSNTAPLAQNTPPLTDTLPADNTPVKAEANAAPAGDGLAPPPFQPGGSSAGKSLPEIGSKMIYVVQKGDTLAKISAKIYGSGGRWNELATLSQLPNPSRIFPGDLIYYTLDESAVTFATAYESVQRSEEQVKQGDTLATIAKRVYGNPNAWRAIWRENDKIDNPDVIPPGSTIFYVSQGAAAAALNKVQAVMATYAKATPAKDRSKNFTTKSSGKGSRDVSKITVAKASKLSNSVLLAGSQNPYANGLLN